MIEKQKMAKRTRGTLNLLTQESVGVIKTKPVEGDPQTKNGLKTQQTPGEKLTGTSGTRTQPQSRVFS